MWVLITEDCHELEAHARQGDKEKTVTTQLRSAFAVSQTNLGIYGRAGARCATACQRLEAGIGAEGAERLPQPRVSRDGKSRALELRNLDGASTCHGFRRVHCHGAGHTRQAFTAKAVPARNCPVGCRGMGNHHVRGVPVKHRQSSLDTRNVLETNVADAVKLGRGRANVSRVAGKADKQAIRA